MTQRSYTNMGSILSTHMAAHKQSPYGLPGFCTHNGADVDVSQTPTHKIKINFKKETIEFLKHHVITSPYYFIPKVKLWCQSSRSYLQRRN